MRRVLLLAVVLLAGCGDGELPASAPIDDDDVVADDDDVVADDDDTVADDDDAVADDDDAVADDDDATAEPEGAYVDDDLATDWGCPGVYNPGQLLAYQFDMAPADWTALRADSTNSVYFEAEMSCNGGPAMTVGIRRKRSGGADKPGLKVDPNRFVEDQFWFDLHKLSFENGYSSLVNNTFGGTASVSGLIEEFLAWRMMVKSGAVTGRAALAQVTVNSELIGVYVNVENPDKRYLRVRLGKDGGWLYKKSGGDGDGYKTREGEDNPHEAFFCFFRRNQACPQPPPAEIEAHLDVPNFLRFGAALAVIGNTDSPLLKDNNYYFYDSEAGLRTYFPWDLDTCFRGTYDVLTGTVPGGVDFYRDAVLPTWEADYRAILAKLVAGPLSVASMQSELDTLATVAGAALDTDPYATGDVAGASEDLLEYWEERIPAVEATLAQ